jgi:hypothetical protein
MKTSDQKLLEEAYLRISKSSSENWEPLLDELIKSIPGPKIFSLLQKVKSSGKISELISHLNSQEDWDRKDNLIKALFMGLTTEEI